MFKVNIFIPKDRTFDSAQLAHRIHMEVSRDPKSMSWVLSAEDIVLTKLDWFKMGGEVSERQWRDVLGVLKVQGATLNIEYMRSMAMELNVLDLLTQALDEAQR